jgi:threonyl-tRNA synthetase
MNCPGSVSMFAQGLQSYRDLPLRMAEFDNVHRYEPSGVLHGLMRVRHCTQDDAHIHCTEEQMEQECIDVVALVLDHVLYPGEGACYGTKLEFVLRDAIGRDWQCGTLQVDMNLPERFDISYVDEEGTLNKRPVMLHRAQFGSLSHCIGPASPQPSNRMVQNLVRMISRFSR